MRPLPGALTLVLLLGSARAAQEAPAPPPPGGAKVLREKHPNGKLRLECRFDNDGKLHGGYTEWYPTGQKKLAGAYVHGLLDGPWDAYLENGKIYLRRKYAAGVLKELVRLDADARPFYQVVFGKDGPTLQIPGNDTAEPVFPRSKDLIRTNVAELEGPGLPNGEDGRPRIYAEPYSLEAPHKAGTLDDAYQKDALRHLVTYRWLCGLSTDQVLDPECTSYAQHGAVVLGVVKELTHYPKQPPDMDPAFFERGYKGTSSSNIASGSDTLRDAIDMFMHDSDPSNIDRVGHRGWILNPRMGKTGFGQVHWWICQWSVDSSAEVERPELVAYPSRGYFPVEYLSPSAAWSCNLDRKTFQFPPKNKGVQVRVWTLTPEFDLDREIPLDHFSVSGSTVIFRPKLDRQAPREGLRALVRITGLKRGKEDASAVYVTELFGLTRP